MRYGSSRSFSLEEMINRKSNNDCGGNWISDLKGDGDDVENTRNIKRSNLNDIKNGWCRKSKRNWLPSFCGSSSYVNS